MENYLCVVFEPFLTTFSQKQRSWAFCDFWPQKSPSKIWGHRFWPRTWSYPRPVPNLSQIQVPQKWPFLGPFWGSGESRHLPLLEPKLWPIAKMSENPILTQWPKCACIGHILARIRPNLTKSAKMIIFGLGHNQNWPKNYTLSWLWAGSKGGLWPPAGFRRCPSRTPL